MDRIVNVDLREALTGIAENNTFYHLDNDIKISFDMMEQAAKISDHSEKTLIWVSYPAGIDCYVEREVLQKDTRGYHGVLYHGEGAGREPKLAYAVDVTELKDGKIFGNLYELDIREYAEIVKATAVPSNAMQLFYDDVRRNDKFDIMPLSEFNSRYPLDLPKMVYWRNLPADTEALNTAINNMWDKRVIGSGVCTIWHHTDKLADRRLLFHADKLIAGLNKQQETNSPCKNSFTAALDTIIAHNFNPEQLGRLLDKLPYKNASFAVLKGQRDMKLVVPKNEVLQLRQEQEQGKTEKQGKADNAKERSKTDKPAKPSLLAALESGEQKVKQQFGDKTSGKDTPKKNKTGLGD